MRRSIRAAVRSRAGRRCEYCCLHESDQPLFRFHCSCHECNLGKSSNLSGRDFETGRIVTLFNPRRNRWRRHFAWDGAVLTGLTPCGRVTIDVLNINTEHRVELRRLLIIGGVFPPE